ncbi:MAG: hypothetical protein DRJ01_02105 [Bacteroidetes bacterium]|nr:MAG: hypothetical protein DRJ01_02105 [Bacteroidota bacterium]
MSYIHSSIISKVQYYENKPIFSVIELNLLNYCNRSCSFCPSIVPATKKEMSPLTYLSVILQLRNMGFEGLLSFSGFSEPTLHTDLYYYIDMKNKFIPNAHLTMNTNGDFLTDDIIDLLFKKGIDDICISVYEKETLKKFDNKRIIEYNNKRLVFKDRFSNEDFVNNRAGSLFSIEKPLKNICYYPYYSIYVDYNGDILFCPHDYNKTIVLGNILNNDSLLDTWNGKEINKIRGNRNHLPCSNCDVLGDLMGKEHYEEYTKRL